MPWDFPDFILASILVWRNAIRSVFTWAILWGILAGVAPFGTLLMLTFPAVLGALDCSVCCGWEISRWWVIHSLKCPRSLLTSVEQGCFAPWPKAMRSKPVKWLCLAKIAVRTIKFLQIHSSAYFRLCWNSFQGILLVSRICYSVVSKDPTEEMQMPKVLKPFLGQDEIRSVAPKALTHLMRDPWGVSVLWPLILIPSCFSNKSILLSSADFFNHSDRAIKADIMSCKHCKLRVQVCA